MPTTSPTITNQITIESDTTTPTSPIMRLEILSTANTDQPPSSELHHGNLSSVQASDPTPNLPTSHVITRSMTWNSKPKEFLGFHLYLSAKSTKQYPVKALHTSILPREPTSFSQAASNLDWLTVMQSESQVLLDNETWTLYPRPKDRHVIHNKLYRIQESWKRK